MRLTWKFSLALAVGILIILGINGYVRLRRETGLFRSDIGRDDRLIGRTIAGSVERTWPRFGPEQALDLVANANERENQIGIRWVWLDAAPGDADAPVATSDVLASVLQGKVITSLMTLPGETHETAVTYAPVRLPGQRPGAVELRESMEEEQRYIDTTIRDLVVVTLGLVVFCGLLALGLGIAFVGRPMAQLVEQSRRIGLGDLDRRLALRQRDEIGVLAGEMNAMCDRLAAARTRVETETRARVEALEQLRHADRLLTVGKLAAGIAHELGTPLAVVAGYAQMIVEDQPAGAASGQHARLIAEQAQRMTDIIGNLLDFARPRTPARDAHDVATVVQGSLAFLEPVARKRGVELAFTPPAEARVASIDHGLIQQALANLVVNAMQAMPDGGTVRVSVDAVTELAPADVTAASDRWIRIRVVDQGSGMAPEVLARIFEPFFTTKEVGVGTGLGLSITYGIVREHGGWVAAASELGRGTTVDIFVPAEVNA